ncbi:MAG: protein kinase [Planctomycetota bacterium]
MTSDYTQQQSLGGLEKAEALSLQSASPPAHVDGYQLERLLGRGAFGQVWLANDLNTGRKVAIKFYLNSSGVNLQLINREVQHLVNMSTGRYIVQVLHVGWDVEPPYYVMEYMENGSLEDMVREHGTLSTIAATKMFREIAEGLAYAHARGVFHCDLKPANVVLDQDWRPRIADFGQSRMSDDQTPSLGTLFFMAPEQADLEAPPNASWDVYALGAIAYSLLVGSPPYRTPEAVETLDTADSLAERLSRYQQTIRKSTRPREHYRLKGTDKALCQIIDRCLAADPKARYSNVQQVIGALESRSKARSRRPLYILGILGPLLLLPLMLFFSSISIKTAKDETIQELRQQSIRSNKDTCRYAAKTLESEIATLFDLVDDEARDVQLQKLLAALVAVAPEDLEAIARQDNAVAQDRIQKLPEQLALSKHLKERLQQIMQQEQGNKAIFNTMFVNDARGNNVGIYFADPDDQGVTSPVGRNFAYRSYFTGARADGDVSEARSQFRPTTSTRLSAHFKSKSTQKWKVGISTPIWGSDKNRRTPLGVLVLTINLGEFQLLASDDSASSERFASLVDGRDGNGKGVLIQHPFLRALKEQKEVPQMDSRFWEDMQANPGITSYRDPAARYEGGEEFEGEWIAALQPVHLPQRSGANSGPATSDLWVLVQERSSTVSDPVERLGDKLQRETYLEFAALLAVMLVLWFFVFQLGRRNMSSGRSSESNLHSSSYSTLDNGG